MKKPKRTRPAPPQCFALELRHFAACSGIEDASAAFGVDRAALEDQEAMVPITLYYAALERAAAHCGDAHFGLRFALYWSNVARDGIGAMHFLLLSSPSLRVACERILDYQRYWNPAETYDLVSDARTVSIRHRCWGPLREAHFHQAEKTAVLTTFVARAADPACKPLSVTFPHRHRGEPEKLMRVLGTKPKYGAAWTEITLPVEIMDKPLPNANPALFDLMDRYVRREMTDRPADDESYASRVFATVQRLLHERGFGQESVARGLGCGARTLSRRLSDEGTTLREIVDAVRRGRAEALLEAGVAITEVAFLLGYSEPAAFQHAFRRWFKKAPKAWLEARTKPLHLVGRKRA